MLLNEHTYSLKRFYKSKTIRRDIFLQIGEKVAISEIKFWIILFLYKMFCCICDGQCTYKTLYMYTNEVKLHLSLTLACLVMCFCNPPLCTSDRSFSKAKEKRENIIYLLSIYLFRGNE